MHSFSDVPQSSGALGDGVVLLDVRSDDEWSDGHVDGAVHIPLNELPERVADIPEGDLWIHCEVGGRASQAAQYLAAQGLEARVLGENMLGAQGAGFTVVRGS